MTGPQGATEEGEKALFAFSPSLLGDETADGGERDAEWARVFHHFDPRLRSYFKGRCDTSAGLDDLVSEIWRKVFLHIGSLKTPAAAWSWMLMIGRNLLSDYGRKQAIEKRRAEAVLEWQVGQPEFDSIALEWLHEDAFDGFPNRVAVLQAIAALPDDDRMLLELITLHELSHQAIANRLGLKSAAASRKRLERIRKGLLTAFKSKEP